VLAVVGDLVEDIVVWPDAPARRGTDTTAHVERRRGSRRLRGDGSHPSDNQQNREQSDAGASIHWRVTLQIQGAGATR
jgi:hypothetical protein